MASPENLRRRVRLAFRCPNFNDETLPKAIEKRVSTREGTMV
jgi:hypothetical protein